MVKAPILQLEPKIVQYGPNLQLETAVEANPEPVVRWVKDDKPLEPNDPQFVIKTEKLTVTDMYRLTVDIQNFDKHLAGLYKCLVENEHGKTAASFTVSAGDVPDFNGKPIIVQRNKGEILGIKIKAKSKQELTVEWTKNEKTVVESDRVKMITKKGDEPDEFVLLLEIKGPMKDDEATYKCTVKNKDGTNSQSLDLAFD